MGKRKTKHKPTAAAVARARSRAQRACCSAAWADDVAYRHVPYPPPADTTPMRRCDRCLRWYPFFYFPAGTTCEECRAEGWTDEFASNVPGSNWVGLVHGVGGSE